MSKSIAIALCVLGGLAFGWLLFLVRDRVRALLGEVE